MRCLWDYVQRQTSQAGVNGMFVGHFAVALAAKKTVPRVRLGTLVMAAQWLDLLWPVFLLLNLEQVRTAPGITRFSPFDFVSYPYTHSLAADRKSVV